MSDEIASAVSAASVVATLVVAHGTPYRRFLALPNHSAGHHVTAELKYSHPSGLSLAPTGEWVPESYYLDSQNTAKNGSWSTAGLRAEWLIARAGLTAFAEGRNLFDRKYSASVQVDNAAGKYYEPADGRSFYGGLRWTP